MNKFFQVDDEGGLSEEIGTSRTQFTRVSQDGRGDSYLISNDFTIKI